MRLSDNGMMGEDEKSVEVLLGRNFEEIEYVVPVSIWRYADLKVTTLSCTDSLSVRGVTGITVLADAYLEDAQVRSDVLFLPGGEGCEVLRKHPLVLEKIRAYAAQEKRIAAICAAPLLLHDLGLLEGRHYTAYACRELFMAHRSMPVVQDRHILTGRDPGAVFSFSLQLLQAFGISSKEAKKAADIIRGMGLKELWKSKDSVKNSAENSIASRG